MPYPRRGLRYPTGRFARRRGTRRTIPVAVAPIPPLAWRHAAWFAFIAREPPLLTARQNLSLINPTLIPITPYVVYAWLNP